MKIKADQLAAHLKNSMAPAYIVSGDEPLQLSECVDRIRTAGRDQGFSEREIMHVEKSFDWQGLSQAANELSLFSDKKIIELRLASTKLGDAGSKALLNYMAAPSSENLLLITAPKLDQSVQKTKWFKELEKIGVNIQVWPIAENQLQGWVANRARKKGLNITPEAAHLLAERAEGNLLSVAQEIEKLVLTTDGVVDVDMVIDQVTDSAKYDVFGLVDAALLGKSERVVRILNNLKSSGAEPTLISWSLVREIRVLTQLAIGRSQGKSLMDLMQVHRIWKTKVPMMKQAVVKLSTVQWQSLLKRAAKLDRLNKGLAEGDPWDELLKLSLAMSGTQLLREKQ